jgi:hypothetical protein
MEQARKALGMFWRKTRDIVIETHTIVKRVELNFVEHEKKQDDQVYKLHKLIKDCKDSVGDIKKAKKCRKEIITDWLKYTGVACVIIGTLFGVLRYQESKKKFQAVKIEKMLEQILEK